MYGQKPPKKKKPVKRKSDSELSARSLAARKAYEEQRAKKQQVATTYSSGTKKPAKPTTQKQIKASRKAKYPKTMSAKARKNNGIAKGSWYPKQQLGGATLMPNVDRGVSGCEGTTDACAVRTTTNKTKKRKLQKPASKRMIKNKRKM